MFLARQNGKKRNPAQKEFNDKSYDSQWKKNVLFRNRDSLDLNFHDHVTNCTAKQTGK